MKIVTRCSSLLQWVFLTKIQKSIVMKKILIVSLICCFSSCYNARMDNIENRLQTLEDKLEYRHTLPQKSKSDMVIDSIEQAYFDRLNKTSL